MKKLILFLYFILVLNTNFLIAEEVPKILSLDQTLELGFWNNPEMLEARKEIEASKGRRFDAEMLPSPEVEIEGSDTFIVKQPLDVPGTRFLKGQIAKNGVKIANYDLHLLWGKIRQEIINLYNTILAEEKAEDVAEDNLNLTKHFLTRVETRFQSGTALQSELLRAKIEASKAENYLLVAEKNRKVSMGKLNIALGFPVETKNLTF